MENEQFRALKALQYIKARLGERSTWMAIGVGVGGAAALVSPWSFVAVGVAIIGSLVPSAGAPDA